MDSVSIEIEELEQQFKDTESASQRQYIEQKLKVLYATFRPDREKMHTMQGRHLSGSRSTR